MARKKLFGNVNDPRCETCLQGKLSSDGDSILCKRGGVLPLSHHCRHFQYDPLRRTPHRVRPLEEFDATEFALDDLSAEWLEAVVQEDMSPEDVKHAELMKKLRMYLNETAVPNVDDILVLLNETPVAPEDTETLLAEADALLGEKTGVPASIAKKDVTEQADTVENDDIPFEEADDAATEEVADEENVIEADDVASPPAVEAAEQTIVEDIPVIDEEIPEDNDTTVDIVDDTAEDTAQVVAKEVVEINLTEELLKEAEAFRIAEDAQPTEKPVEVMEEAVEPAEEATPVEDAQPVEEEVVETTQGEDEVHPEDEAQPEEAKAQPEDEAQPEDNKKTEWHSDSSMDIAGDLERLKINVVQSAITSAFRNFDLKLTDDTQPAEEREDIEVKDAFSEDALLTTLHANDTEDDGDETLRAEDLIFLSEMHLIENDNDSIEMNPDGTFKRVQDF